MKPLNHAKLTMYIDNLRADIYPQPNDKGHFAWAIAAIKKAYNGILYPRVLDVGCGDAFTRDIFNALGCEDWTGVTFNVALEAVMQYPNEVIEADMSDLPQAKGSVDFILCRHVLEHSVMPLITLMEFHRVISPEGVLLLIAPAPDTWGVRGKNHYSVLYREQLSWLLNRAGWDIIDFSEMTNHDNEYLTTWGPWDEAMAKGKTRQEMLAILPDGPKAVEYRFLCTPTAEVKE